MRFDQVWFRYARRAGWTLRPSTRPSSPGETVVVLGRNGAGKSTLLQLAAGVLRPVRGAVRDRPAVVGWVPERFPADQPFTAEQYLHRMAALRGLRGAPTVDRWIERLGSRAPPTPAWPTSPRAPRRRSAWPRRCWSAPACWCSTSPGRASTRVARTLIPAIVGEVTAAGGAVLVSDHRGEIAGLPGRDPLDGRRAARCRPAARRRRREPDERRRARSRSAGRTPTRRGPAACRRSPCPRRYARAGRAAGGEVGPMIALVRMRLAAFVRSGRALAPLIAGLVVLGVIYGGGQSPAARGLRLLRGRCSSRCWPGMTKLLLDAEPDVQRRLARLAVGAGREAVAGLLAAARDRPGRLRGGDARAVAVRRHRRPEPGEPSLAAGDRARRAGPPAGACRPRWRWARWPAGR